MAKQGMACPDRTHPQSRNEGPPVPEIQGKAKSGKKKVLPVITDNSGPNLKVFHNAEGAADD